MKTLVNMEKTEENMNLGSGEIHVQEQPYKTWTPPGYSQQGAKCRGTDSDMTEENREGFLAPRQPSADAQAHCLCKTDMGAL